MAAKRVRGESAYDAAPVLSLAAAPRALAAIIIDAARGERRLDSRQSEPASFARIDGQGRVLDWLLHALRASDARQITFVGGYHIQKVIQQYPELQFRFLAQWSEQGEVEALRMATGVLNGACDVVIARATSLCLPGAIEALRGDEEAISVGLYDAAQGRAAWAGVMHVPARCACDVKAIADALATERRGANLTDLIAALEGHGQVVRRASVARLATPMDDDAAVAEIAFRGKARTLEQVAPLLSSAVVPESMRVSAADWRRDAQAIEQSVRERFGSALVAVRSSAANEDAITASLAGRFRSVLNVQSDQSAALRSAVERVIASFTQGDRASHADDEFIVQRQVKDLASCGVVLTRDVSTGGPYFVVHVDRMDGAAAPPDRVTAGVTGGAGVHYVLRRDELSSAQQGELGPAIELARELEKLTCRDGLDIEFGVTTSGELNLLQVRPLAHRTHELRMDDDLALECTHIHAHVADAMREHPLLAGRTTVFSTMADWNPAEMIGPAPKPLALSLYQRLIGSEAWSQSRTLLGYRSAWPAPLIHSLGGRPFVDVRASLNSLLPSAMDDDVAAQLVDDGIERLKSDPSAHDKIEFEIAHSCATLDVDRDRTRLREAGLSNAACALAMRAMAGVTDAMLMRERSEMASLEQLQRTIDQWRAAQRATMHGHAAQVRSVLAMCAAHGVTPFAMLARQAFVALAMLRSLRRLDVLTENEHEHLLKSIPTVASELDRDVSLWARGKMEREALVARYGHLRPSSYDITSLSYAEAWSSYFGEAERWREVRAFPDVRAAGAMLNEKRSVIERLLRASGLSAPFEAWCTFIITSIQQRESGKFIFMRAVHDVLESAARVGEQLGFAREDVAMLPIGAVEALGMNAPSGAVEMEWGRQIEFGRKRWALTSALRLPGVIRSPDDVFSFEVEGARATFVSQARVSGRVVVGDDAKARALEASAWRGAIVLLRAADPGYDWLFSKGIAGLITAWGGAGSHMAIRAAEFGLPAAIGCGELMFDSLAQAHTIELDCGVQTMRVLS